ncbi:hypothetical protein KFL01_17310 [Kocuria flava]|uniref:Uncharacterized protein n=2 Tax=Kocuria flava TaxID=446860 RepID=A0ABQ0XC87_9MICC|nr:hypothetical protein KFL01_17310 [Kocuria flava]
MTGMSEQHAPTRTINGRSDRGSSGPLIAIVLGFLLSLAAMVGVGIVSLDMTEQTLGDEGAATVQEPADGH